MWFFLFFFFLPFFNYKKFQSGNTCYHNYIWNPEILFCTSYGSPLNNSPLLLAFLQNFTSIPQRCYEEITPFSFKKQVKFAWILFEKQTWHGRDGEQTPKSLLFQTCIYMYSNITRCVSHMKYGGWNKLDHSTVLCKCTTWNLSYTPHTHPSPRTHEAPQKGPPHSMLPVHERSRGLHTAAENVNGKDAKVFLELNSLQQFHSSGSSSFSHWGLLEDTDSFACYQSLMSPWLGGPAMKAAGGGQLYLQPVMHLLTDPV